MKPYLDHLTTAAELVTTREAIRAGFVTAALEKNKLADPFVNEARILQVKASQAKQWSELLDIQGIRAGLLTAAGVSDKATNHLLPVDEEVILKEFFRNFLEPAGAKFVEELVYRFLLIRGDTLGGRIRNLAGAWAQTKLTMVITSSLFLAGRSYYWLDSETNQWKEGQSGSVKTDAKGLSWDMGGACRVLLYNIKVPIIKKETEDDNAGKNVDLCLLDCEADRATGRRTKKTVVRSPSTFVALGELKGGIDPSGADEHWKTANAHLDRIRRSFLEHGASPSLFFVGGAIENSMAAEIWSMLEAGTLANAANLTDEKQMVSLVSWLCGL